MPKITDLDPPKLPKSLPKWPPNRTKKQWKIIAKNWWKKTPLQDRLGTVLGRSWAVLWPLWGSFLLIFYWFLKLFVKIHFLQKISFQEPSWAQLGTSWVDFGTPKAPQMPPQNDSKTIKKVSKKTRRKKNEKRRQIDQKNLTQLWTESGVWKRFSLSSNVCFVLVCLICSNMSIFWKLLKPNEKSMNLSPLSCS